jgi:hypothetical protein
LGPVLVELCLLEGGEPPREHARVRPETRSVLGQQTAVGQRRNVLALRPLMFSGPMCCASGAALLDTQAVRGAGDPLTARLTAFDVDWYGPERTDRKTSREIPAGLRTIMDGGGRLELRCKRYARAAIIRWHRPAARRFHAGEK